MFKCPLICVSEFTIHRLTNNFSYLFDNIVYCAQLIIAQTNCGIMAYPS